MGLNGLRAQLRTAQKGTDHQDMLITEKQCKHVVCMDALVHMLILAE